MTSEHDGRNGRDGQTGLAGQKGDKGDKGDSGMSVDSEEFAYMKARLDEISATLCDLKPLTVQISNLVTTVTTVVEQVKGHSVTLYGERTESGLVGRLEQLEQLEKSDIEHIQARVNQIMAAGSVIGTAIILWLLSQWLGMIHP